MRLDRLIAFGNARLASTRCPRKMLRPFAGTTLTHIALERLNRLGACDGVYFAAWEPELLDVARDYANVTVIERSERSATVCNPISAVHDYLRDIDFDYACWINSCLAFLKPETVSAALAAFRADPEIRALTAVTRTQSWYYDMDGRPVNNLDCTCVDTKKSPPLFEVCHAFHLFSKTQLFNHDAYWSHGPKDPFLFEIDHAEAVDVDTELDFKVAEQLYEQSAAPAHGVTGVC